jgi:hypothetical protein
MKKLLLLSLLFAALFRFLPGQESIEIQSRYFSDPDIMFNTPTLSIDEDRFASHEEVMDWIARNIEGRPGAEVRIIGESEKGLAIPVIYLQRPGMEPKLKVWFQGVLHGNEPAGAEGLLYLATQLLNDEQASSLLDHLSVAILPIANMDGYVAMERRSAGGFDLNRDQTKYADPVSRIIRSAFIDWDPDIAYDIHEFTPTRGEYAGLGERGATISYDVKFLPSGYMNVPEGLRRASVEIFQADAEKALEKHGYTHHFYFTADLTGDEMVLNKGAKNPQSSSTSYALSNAISMLVETRGIGLGRTSLARRTHSVYIVSMACLTSAAENIDIIRDVLETARRETVLRRNEIVVLSEPVEKYYDVEFIDLQSAEMIAKSIRTRDALDMLPLLVRKRPVGYLLEAGSEREVEILKLLGLKLTPADPRRKYRVESYLISDYQEAEKSWEKIRPVTARAVTISTKRRFAEGTWYLDLAQKNANYAVSLLEPESENGFVSFRVTETGAGQKLRIHRVMK